MLIRLVSHPVRNKWAVDKLIFIEGIPEELIYYKREGKNYIREPWTRDVTENIPEYIRSGITPFSVRIYTSPTEKGLPAMDEEFTAYGLVLDYQNPRAEEIWKRIERMIDQDTPRGEALPEPVLVSTAIDNDHRMLGFDIKDEDIPRVILTVHPPKIKAGVKQVSVPVVAALPSIPCICTECKKEFKVIQGLRMHQMKTKHQQRVPQAAGASNG